MVSYQSGVQMIQKKLNKAVSMKNTKSDILIAGFIKNMSIPSELLQIIYLYFDSQIICLFGSDGDMYKIELYDILKDKHSDLSMDYFPKLEDLNVQLFTNGISTITMQFQPMENGGFDQFN